MKNALEKNGVQPLSSDNVEGGGDEQKLLPSIWNSKPPIIVQNPSAKSPNLFLKTRYI